MKKQRKWKPKNVKLTDISRLSKYSQSRALFGGWRSVEVEYAKQVESARRNGLGFPEPLGVYKP